jgi:hypothetical protein
LKLRKLYGVNQKGFVEFLAYKKKALEIKINLSDFGRNKGVKRVLAI